MPLRGNSLTSLSLPDSVVTIGEWSFYENPNLTTIYFGESLQHIDNYAFYNTPALTTVTFLTH